MPAVLKFKCGCYYTYMCVAKKKIPVVHLNNYIVPRSSMLLMSKVNHSINDVVKKYLFADELLQKMCSAIWESIVARSL